MYYPTKFQWSVLQIGQDSSIYILDIIKLLGWVYDILSHCICIFYTYELMQIIGNGKQFLFFHGILCYTPKKSRGKNLIIVPLLTRCDPISRGWGVQPVNHKSQRMTNAPIWLAYSLRSNFSELGIFIKFWRASSVIFRLILLAMPFKLNQL